jgi:hypothetical protein
MIAISQRVIFAQARKDASKAATVGTPALSLLSIGTAIAGLACFGPLLLWLVQDLFMAEVNWLGSVMNPTSHAVVLIVLIIFLLAFIHLPLFILIYISKHRLKVTFVILLSMTFFG